MSTPSVQLYSRGLSLYSVYCTLINSRTRVHYKHTLDCVHRVHTIDCTACRMYTVKCVHMYIFAFVQYMYTHCTEIS
jgi:hypothetical protein